MPSLQEHVHQAAEMARALGATLPRPFVSPTFLIAVFLGTGGERSAGWFGGLKSDGLHDVSPASQSAHVFGVSRGRLEMSEEKKRKKEKKGLTDSSHGAANWQLRHDRSPKSPDDGQ